MKNIIVTGGAGYIGSILVPELLQKGYRVTVIDNFLYKQNSLANICHNPNFQVIKGDVRSKHVIVPLISKADIIIPLAALVGAPVTKQNSVASKIPFCAQRALSCRPLADHYLKRRRLKTRSRRTTDRAHDQIAWHKT